MRLSLARAFGRGATAAPTGPTAPPGGDAANDASTTAASRAGEAGDDASTAPDASDDGAPERDPATFAASADSNNVVRRTVREISALLDETHHLREELVARGVQTQTINVLVEMAFHGRHDEREPLLESAVAASEATYGAGAITRDGLLTYLKQLDELEKDIQHARRLARQHGLDLQVLNFLTQIIRRHPGDGGARSLNAFFGYALACGIELDGIADVAQRFGDKPRSVLPDVRRGKADGQDGGAPALLRDAAIGVVLAAGLLLMMA